ncbi:MAG TPA: ABC transporter ATP-binding protein [Verrucomicrobiae bacterium]|nr:ABC transporter ATP-binding protein [Verrucomicrobiae bacterium]
MLRVSGLKKRFQTEQRAGVIAVNDISFEVDTGKLLTLLGPSGCGKTTTLRAIAGLEEPDDGEIQLGSRVVFSAAKAVAVPSNRRRVGMVFQSYAIWPHMTVFQNVAYPLEGGGISRNETRERVARVLGLVGLEELMERPAPFLSGGQQQRVALARALVAEPEVLLLDEPLSNLDAKLREQMRVELRAVQQRVGLTAVYVTHDQTEALAISDVIGVMNAGRLVEYGTPGEIYDRPRSRFAAEFIGAANVIPLSDLRSEGGKSRARTPWGEIHFLSDGQKIARSIVIRPEDFQIIPNSEGENIWPAQLEQVIFLGAAYECRLALSGTTLRAQFPRSAALSAGQQIFVRVDFRRCIPLEE